MTSPEAPVPSDTEPTGSRPVLPSGIEAGLVGGLAVAAVFLVHDVLLGSPLQTPALLGTLMFQGLEAARAGHLAPGAAIAYNAVHFGAWVGAGALGSVFMRDVEASPSHWYRPWLAAAALVAGCSVAAQAAAAAGLPRLHLIGGSLAGVVATGAFLGWRYPAAMRHVRSMGGA